MELPKITSNRKTWPTSTIFKNKHFKDQRNKKLQGELLTRSGIYQVNQLYEEDNGWISDKELREAGLTFAERMEWNGKRGIVKACTERLGIIPVT